MVAKRARQSAGVLLFRRRKGVVEVLLAHPGGPFFARKDDGAWSLPKGEIEEGEDPLQVARREFREETGQPLEVCALGKDPIPLGSVRQKGGKVVHAFAFEGDWPEGAAARSETFSIEWPKGSGRIQSFPEVDRVEIFDAETAVRKLNEAQAEFVARLLVRLARG